MCIRRRNKLEQRLIAPVDADVSATSPDPPAPPPPAIVASARSPSVRSSRSMPLTVYKNRPPNATSSTPTSLPKEKHAPAPVQADTPKKPMSKPKEVKKSATAVKKAKISLVRDNKLRDSHFSNAGDPDILESGAPPSKQNSDEDTLRGVGTIMPKFDDKEKAS